MVACEHWTVIQLLQNVLLTLQAARIALRTDLQLVVLTCRCRPAIALTVAVFLLTSPTAGCQ